MLNTPLCDIGFASRCMEQNAAMTSTLYENLKLNSMKVRLIMKMAMTNVDD